MGAAFLRVPCGKQRAGTTVLLYPARAQQHCKQLPDRFAEWPIKVSLSFSFFDHSAKNGSRKLL